MGAWYDYFRAADVAAVEKIMTESGSGWRPPAGGVDIVDTKVEYALELGQLIALAADVDDDSDLFEWPTVWEADDDEDVWVVHLDSLGRDRLAGVPDDAVPDLAYRWAQIEEFGGETTGPELFPIVTGLVRLARRARRTGDQLYCRVSL